jgi:hypothetical protein
MDLVIMGVSGLLIVKYIINALKQMGLSTKLALPAAIIVGIALAVANKFAVDSVVVKAWFETALTGLFIGLGAAEVYDAGKRADNTLDIRQAELELKTA